MRDPVTLVAQSSAPEPSPERPSPEQADAARQWAALMLVLTLLGVIAISTLAIMVLTRRRHLSRQRSDQSRRDDGVAALDPWVEAGRRAEPLTDESRDEGAEGEPGDEEEAS